MALRDSPLGEAVASFNIEVSGPQTGMRARLLSNPVPFLLRSGPQALALISIVVINEGAKRVIVHHRHHCGGVLTQEEMFLGHLTGTVSVAKNESIG